MSACEPFLIGRDTKYHTAEKMNTGMITGNSDINSAEAASSSESAHFPTPPGLPHNSTVFSAFLAMIPNVELESCESETVQHY
jgi:hypothetical protein